MAYSHTKADSIFTTADDAKALIDLLDIAQSACLMHADELSQAGALTGAGSLLQLASRAYDMRERLQFVLDESE